MAKSQRKLVMIVVFWGVFGAIQPRGFPEDLRILSFITISEGGKLVHLTHHIVFLVLCYVHIYLHAWLKKLGGCCLDVYT
jgi:hypothetical protein